MTHVARALIGSYSIAANGNVPHHVMLIAVAANFYCCHNEAPEAIFYEAWLHSVVGNHSPGVVWTPPLRRRPPHRPW